MSRSVKAVIYFPEESQRETTVWVDEDATEEDIKVAILDEALSMIEIDYYD